jgi:PAS domain S-box-containing protein
LAVSIDSSAKDERTVEELRSALEELQAAHKELVEAERQRYQQLFHSAPLPYLVTDRHGVIREANQLAAAVLGVPPLRLPGKPLVVFVDQTARRDFRQFLLQLDEEREHTLILPLVPRDGHAVPVRASVAASATAGARQLRWILHPADLDARGLRDSAVGDRSTLEVKAVLTEVAGLAAALPMAVGAAVALQLPPGAEVRAGADERSLTLLARSLQGGGPAATALAEARPVGVSDSDWPEAHGVWSLPLHRCGDVVGVLDLYANEPGDALLEAGLRLSDLVSSWLSGGIEAAEARRLAQQLQVALDSRIVIEQAKGRLAERHGTSLEDAFAQLRRLARREGRPLRDVAEAVASGTLAP